MLLTAGRLRLKHQAYQVTEVTVGCLNGETKVTGEAIWDQRALEHSGQALNIKHNLHSRLIIHGALIYSLSDESIVASSLRSSMLAGLIGMVR